MVGKRHRLISTRKAAGFSQERLAEKVGVERSTVMRWERGETPRISSNTVSLFQRSVLTSCVTPERPLTILGAISIWRL
jgi:DNA-binding XRE family transcriptional regulator